MSKNIFGTVFASIGILIMVAFFVVSIYLICGAAWKYAFASPQANIEISDIKSNSPIYAEITENGYQMVTIFAPASYTINSVALGDDCRYYYTNGDPNGSVAYGSNTHKVQINMANDKLAVYTIRCQSAIGGADIQKTLIVNVVSSGIRAPTFSAMVR